MTREGAALAAIRAKCLECSGGSRKEAHGCRLRDCPLWPFRGGEPRARARKEGRQLSMFDEIHTDGRGQNAEP